MTRKARFVVGAKPGPGRDSKYEPWMDEQVFRLALLGLKDDEMSKALGIHVGTFYRWQHEHGGFSEALPSGKTRADAEIAHGLYKRAVGVIVTSEKAFKGKVGNVVVAQTKTELPPDPRAAVRWLANRRRKNLATYDEQQAEKAREPPRRRDRLGIAPAVP